MAIDPSQFSRRKMSGVYIDELSIVPTPNNVPVTANVVIFLATDSGDPDGPRSEFSAHVAASPSDSLRQIYQDICAKVHSQIQRLAQESPESLYECLVLSGKKALTNKDP